MRYRSLGVSLRKGLAGLAGHKLLVGILACAFFLRISGNLYDRGYGFHPDEHHYLGIAVTMMREGTFNPAYFQNPPLYTYTVLLGLYGLFGVQLLAGGPGSPAAFVTALPPSVAFGLARGLSALAGTATCLLLFRIGRRVGGPLAGYLAALFAAVAFLSVRDAHFATNDIPMVCLATLAFGFAVRALDESRSRDLALGGLATGLAAATKYNGALALLPLLLAAALGLGAGEGLPGVGKVGTTGRRGVLVLLPALGGFLLGNPYAVLDPAAFLDGLGSQYELRDKAWRGQGAATVPLLVLRCLGIELGWPLLLFVPIAAALALARGGLRAKATGLALSVVLALLGYHSLQALFFARFLLPATPFLALISAWGLGALREAPWAPWARRPAVLVGIVALLLALPLARSAYLAVLLHRPDTRLLAQAYLERVAPVGSAIVQDWRPETYFYLPRLDPLRYRIHGLWSDPSLLHPDSAPAEFYLFTSFVTERYGEVSAALERALVSKLERLGFVRVRLSPLRDGADILVELDAIYLPYRHLFQHERPGPTILIYARPGMPAPPPPDNDGV